MEKYKPDYNRKNTRAAVARAIGYATANLSTEKPRRWSSRHMDKWFGHMHKPLGKFLRQTLTVCVDNHYDMMAKKCKSYTLNARGVAHLSNAIGVVVASIPSANDLNEIALDWAKQTYGDTIASGDFEYAEKSGRLWNDIGNLKNAIRKPLFANYGYVNEYDISCAAPNILSQYARQCGMTRPINTIDEYIAHKEEYRNSLADELGVDYSTAKRLINAKFNGARLGARNSIIDILDNNWDAHDKLKHMTWWMLLHKDIKKIWDTIKAEQCVRTLDARTRWQIYFEQELKVMKSVHKYLDKCNIKYFHEHDGWRCNSAVDLHQLKLHVTKSTGYTIYFDYEVFDV